MTPEPLTPHPARPPVQMMFQGPEWTPDDSAADLYDSSNPASRLLKACAEIFSSWFSAAKSCVKRGRASASADRPARRGRARYRDPGLTPAEESIASLCQSMASIVLGSAPAAFSSSAFQRAVSTGDMRSFKIRLMIIKVRDSLLESDSSLYHGFVEGMEQCITLAEKLAGCKPDPSPRRLSRAERKKLERKNICQPDLPYIWDQDSSQKHHVGSDHKKEDGLADGDNATTAVSYEQRPVHNSENQDSLNDDESVTNRNFEKPVQDIGNPVSVTVTGTSEKCPVTVTGGVVRKAREYETVEQILTDMEEGRITPYQSQDEILEDLSKGNITAVDALMFSAALDRFAPLDSDSEGMARELGLDGDDVDGAYEEEEDPEVSNEEECYGESRQYGRSEYSYNPMGFAGCRGRYSASGADWCPDDEW